MGGHGKKHNKMYVTAKEWAEEFGGKRDDQLVHKSRVPFDVCALSMQPFRDPVMAPDGSIFDILNIVPYIRKFKKNPVSGEPLSVKDLIKVNFHKNANGKYHCPITFKEFNEHSHIVMVKPSGNVYSAEAVEELNAKARNWTDLLTGEPFTRKDIITIQNPQDLASRMIDVEAMRRNAAALREAKGEGSADINQGEFIKGVLSELEKKKADADAAGPADAATASTAATAPPLRTKRAAEPADSDSKKGRVDGSAGADAGTVASRTLTSYHAAASFTSTALAPVTKQVALQVERRKFPKKDGFVRLTTNLGPLNIQLFCPLAPKACENFIALCRKGYYNGVVFHRSIRNFMIQGGDPTGTGRGGSSVWGKPFEDEFTQKLTHGERGILSMANSGRNTNGSQFFILYKPAMHLNFKHTVFGKLVGGLDTLKAMEDVPTDEADRPVHEIKILSAEVFVDPYDDPDIFSSPEDLAEAKKREEAAAAAARRTAERGQWFSNPTAGAAPKPSRPDAVIGKYLPPPS